jgi:hypothetical protein
MEAKRSTHYQEGELLVGWLEDYPDYRTQGETIEALRTPPVLGVDGVCADSAWRKP